MASDVLRKFWKFKMIIQLNTRLLKQTVC